MPLHDWTIDATSELPVFRQIADVVRDAVARGALGAGERLPPTRALARRLGVNRNTVVAAYDLLVADGVISSHTGRGTFVNTPRAVEAPPADPPAFGTPWFTSFSRAVEGPGVGNLLSVYRVAISGDGISFAGSFPAVELLPVEPFRRAMASVLRESGPEVLTYGPTAGWVPLRALIAEEMRRRESPQDADGVLITNGSQQALELIFRALLDPGDAIVLEDPTYTGALSALNALGARLVGVPLDDEGIRLDLLEAALARHRPRALYVQPTFHNPTTRTMTLARRRELLALTERYSCAVIEDDWALDLRFAGQELPTLHALDGGRRVIYISTFSKKLLPGLRLGWVAAPGPVIDRLVALKQIEDCGTSPVLQAALAQFLRDGALDQHLRRVRRAYRERRDAMTAALARSMPEGVRYGHPEGGLFLWVELPGGLDANELFREARQRGVLFSRGELFQVSGGFRDALRLTFAAVSAEEIETGIGILGELVHERVARAQAPGGPRADEAVPIL